MFFAAGAGRGPVDHRLFVTFGTGDLGSLLSFRLHLLFHSIQNGTRRLDILDFIAQHLDAPVLSCIVNRLNHLLV